MCFAELRSVASVADAIRCDMAYLELNDLFQDVCISSASHIAKFAELGSELAELGLDATQHRMVV